MDQENGRLNPGQIWRIVVRQTDRLPARLDELWWPGVRAVDVVHQLVGHQALVVDMHAQVIRDVLAAQNVERLAGRSAALRKATAFDGTASIAILPSNAGVPN